MVAGDALVPNGLSTNGLSTNGLSNGHGTNGHLPPLKNGLGSLADGLYLNRLHTKIGHEMEVDLPSKYHNDYMFSNGNFDSDKVLFHSLLTPEGSFLTGFSYLPENYVMTLPSDLLSNYLF
jgi:hypothetical protein